MSKAYLWIPIAMLTGSAGTLAAGCIDYWEEYYQPLTDPKLATTTSGTGGSSTTTGTGGQGGGGSGGGGGPPVCSGEPSVTNTIEDCAVFVRADAPDANGDGTRDKPYKTLKEAIDKAGEKRVYACTSAPFVEAVTISAGVEVYGGFDCLKGWSWAADSKSTLSGPADMIALSLASGAAAVKVENFAIAATDATKPGGSSIVVLVDGGTAELVRCEVTAGAGMKGKDGDPGDPNGNPAGAGGQGNPGANACMGDVANGNPGGLAMTNACGGMDPVSIGGAGGKGNVTNGSTGDVGQTGAFGGSGTGEPVAGAWSCGGNEPNGAGDIGEDGQPGDPGQGASGLGALSSTGYTGADGQSGKPGTPGQGGGGGGGAKGGAAICAGMSGAGASGGSGGAGGCGGLPGLGGQAGGASIALLSLQGKVTLTDCNLTAGAGAEGGKGGDLQPGGAGGDPGKGGQGVGGTKAGCSGGQGGQGGNGGPGGGGLGGHSIAIAFQGTPVTQMGKTTLTPGTKGKGGPGGSANVAMNAGMDGVAATTQEFK